VLGHVCRNNGETRLTYKSTLIMDGFDDIFREATANISREYFLLPVVWSPSIYRERVYCYELYHQLRRHWPEETTPYRLNGEIDKRGHPYFTEDDWSPKPDLLVPVPGSHNNYAVIEVKTADNLRNREVLKDIDTLTRFINEAGYARGIHLVFGASATETLDLLSRAKIDPDRLGRLEFWGQPEPRVAAERLRPTVIKL
jgi:hypothetical protein